MKSFTIHMETGKKKERGGKLILHVSGYVIKCSYGADLMVVQLLPISGCEIKRKL